ncbi:MAG: glycosyltransferase family 2 protein [Candidatus Rokubacteria bacterium]|nr:glycosyltransferase family 2 protein [Candidatus Rokubacteria bacterium]MBI3827190.1 glycosyltransferase family 2 protein [Candidatus Rokubacteria bacterium]
MVIPAYNEARRVPSYLEEVAAYFEGRGEPHEIIVVDDGSADDTAGAALAVAESHPAIRVLRREVNEGKGGAVRRGMLAARGACRLFTDADGSTPIAELKRLEPHLLVGADVVIGSRGLPDPAVAVVARPHRVLAGRLFTRLVALAGLGGIADTQCGFKVFTAAAAERLFRLLVTTGFAFDVELLLRARAAGLRVVEVPVNWTHRPGSKVGVLRDGPAMLREIVKARRTVRRSP